MRVRGSPTERPLLTCPYLGLPDDPETNYLFAVSMHQCHNVEPQTAVRLDHQQRYCLSSEYSRCPLYQAPEKVKLPHKPAIPLGGLGGAFARLTLPTGALSVREACRSWRQSLALNRLAARRLSKMTLPRPSLPQLSLPRRKTVRRTLLVGTALSLLITVIVILFANRAALQEGMAADPGNRRSPLEVEESVRRGRADALVSAPLALSAEAVAGAASPSPTPAPTRAVRDTPLSVEALHAGKKSPTPTRPQATATEPAPTEPPPTATEPPPTEPPPEPTATATSAEATCGAPAGWVLYTVAPGDTLFRIALRSGASLTQLQRANCLGNSYKIYGGQRIYVPRYLAAPQPSPTPLPVEPTPTEPAPTATEPAPTATEPAPTATEPSPTATATEPTTTPEFLPTRPPPSPTPGT
ncbi:MAG: LysM peptidoglycan-binding domain-containing protein [Candidatus Promineifilaceae bacterium]|nr:LysM peptidoglycan-binding domain-containing protein [Candidatus Promineifilaceae bacterium]